MIGPLTDVAREGTRCAAPPARVGVARSATGEDRSAILRGSSSGPLRLLFPRTSGRAAWVVTSSLGGGLVDGDRVRLELDVGAGATCLLTSQASQKVYRGTSEVALAASIDEGGVLLAVPDPTVPYADASFTQRARVELAPTASLAWMDVVTAGRIARGERWASGRLDLGLELVRAGGGAVLRDRVILDPARASIASKMRRFDALATVALLGPAFADLAAAAIALPSTDDVIVGAGPIDGGAFLRIASATVAGAIEVTRDLLREPCARFGEDPFGRKW